MIRERPLSWLFCIASIVVDLAFLAMAGRYVISEHVILAGLLLGQTAILAIWAGTGGGHRLGRASVMVVATGLVALATGKHALGNWKQWLAVLFGYTLSVYVAAVLISIRRTLAAQRADAHTPASRWQVPLIELFGWTIIVAIVSFAARSMAFDFIRPGDHALEKIVAILATPILFAMCIKNDIRDLSRGLAFWIVLGILAAAALLHWRERWGVLLIATQTCTMVFWYMVLGLDHVMCEARAIEEKKLPEDHSHSTETPSEGDHTP